MSSGSGNGSGDGVAAPGVLDVGSGIEVVAISGALNLSDVVMATGRSNAIEHASFRPLSTSSVYVVGSGLWSMTQARSWVSQLHPVIEVAGRAVSDIPAQRTDTMSHQTRSSTECRELHRWLSTMPS